MSCGLPWPLREQARSFVADAAAALERRVIRMVKGTILHKSFFIKLPRLKTLPHPVNESSMKDEI